MENCGLLERFFAEMRSYFVPAIAVAMIMSGILSARSDDIPTLDVRPVCRGIASQSALEVGLQQTSFEQCVQSEQAVREEVKKEWSTFSAADKQHCVALAKTGGESSYTELITCMEMARDVRALRSAEAGSSRANTTAAPSLPSMAAQPAPATRPAQETVAVKACMADAKSLCPGTTGAGLGGCFRGHLKEVSDACALSLAKLAEVDPACLAHFRQQCANVKIGEGGLEACLKTAADSLSDGCKDALVRAVPGAR
jgi:hypothetical protein